MESQESGRDFPQQDTSDAAPVDGSQVPVSETPATPAHEEADRVSGQPDDVDYSQAGDAEPDDVDTEPGDDVAPEELQQFEQDAPDNPDEVDQEG